MFSYIFYKICASVSIQQLHMYILYPIDINFIFDYELRDSGRLWVDHIKTSEQNKIRLAPTNLHIHRHDMYVWSGILNSKYVFDFVWK